MPILPAISVGSVIEWHVEETKLIEIMINLMHIFSNTMIKCHVIFRKPDSG